MAIYLLNDEIIELESGTENIKRFKIHLEPEKFSGFDF